MNYFREDNKEFQMLSTKAAGTSAINDTEPQSSVTNLPNKLFEVNDIVGNLFWVVKRFENENGQLKQLVQLLLHFKHMLLFSKRKLFTEQEWNQRLRMAMESSSDQFELDLNNCLEKFQKLLGQMEREKICDFVSNKENVVYKKNDQYCPFQDNDCHRRPESSKNGNQSDLSYWFGNAQREKFKLPISQTLNNRSMTINTGHQRATTSNVVGQNLIRSPLTVNVQSRASTLSTKTSALSSTSTSSASTKVYKLVKISAAGEPSKYVKVPYEGENLHRNIVSRTKLVKVVPKLPMLAPIKPKLVVISKSSSKAAAAVAKPSTTPSLSSTNSRTSKRKSDSNDTSYRSSLTSSKNKKKKTSSTIPTTSTPLRKSLRTSSKLVSVRELSSDSISSSEFSDSSDSYNKKSSKVNSKTRKNILTKQEIETNCDTLIDTETIVLGHSYFLKPNVDMFVETTENRHHDKSLNNETENNLSNENGDKSSGLLSGSNVSMTVMRHPKEHLCLIPGCDFVSMYRTQTVGHVYRHFKLAPFRCFSCQQLYHTKSSLYKHVSRTHKYTQFLFYHMDLFTEEATKRGTKKDSASNDDTTIGRFRYTCKMDRCEFVSESLENLTNHLKWHLDQSPFRCPYCERRFSDRHNGYLHVKHSHRRINSDYNRDAILRCPFVGECEFMTEQPDSAQMLEHIEANHQLYRKVPPGWSVDRNGELVVRGEKRRRKIEARIRRKQRKAEDTEEGGVGRSVNYRCTYDKCRFKCKSITEMKAHELRRHRSQPYQCTHYQCEEVFTRLADRRQHIRDVHEIAAYKCEILGCDEAFNMREKLVKHRIEGHTTEGNNQCSFCQKTCASRFNLVRHLQLNHTREGSFPCGIDQCDFVGKIRNDLLSHRNSAHGKKAIKCPFEGCGRILNNQSTYHYHVKRHKNIRNKQCSWPDCGKWFDSNKALNDHHRIHLNYKRYRCKWPGCDYASEQRTNVIKHIRIRHLKLPMTKKQELELNLPVDPNAPRAVDFVEDLPDFQV